MLRTINHVLNTEARFQKLMADAYAIAAQEIWWPQMMCERPGEGARQDVEWLLSTAEIYRLNTEADGLRFDDLVTKGHSVTHEDFGTGLRITRKQWDDDAFGFAGDWNRQLGSRMALDPQYECIRLMNQGETLLCYDGQAFYSKAHPINPYKPAVAANQFDNLVTDMNDIDPSFADATSPDLSSASLVAAIAYIKSQNMPSGRNRNLRPTTLRVGPLLEKRALELTSAAFIGATENVIRKYQIEVLVINEITGYTWHLDCAVGETPDLLPFVRFVRQNYELTSYNGMTQAQLSRENALEWHLRGRFGYMYGHPYQSYRFKGAA